MDHSSNTSDSLKLNINRQSSYSYHVGSHLLASLKAEFGQDAGERAFLVLDENVEHHHGQKLKDELENLFDELHCWTVPSGEASKSMEQWQELIDFLLKNRVRRSSPLIAAGGGVTGDLAGFAASTALRGIPLVHMPTTLLAMVDSSIGGKTGINHETGKNLVGAFYQPRAIYADVQLLKTLERREWINGLAEVIKYGAIRDAEIFEQVSRQVDQQGFENPESWIPLIRRSAGIKMDVVRRDELESGERAFLNFGHTFGHAIEKVAGYGQFSHGEAVYAGMIAAIYASQKLGADISSTTFAPFMPLYPLDFSAMQNQIGDLKAAMRQDKKVKRDDIRLILLRKWGEPFIHRCEDDDLIDYAWNAMFEHFESV